MTDLKPCPFCGKQPILSRGDDGIGEELVCCGFIGMRPKAWNTRPTEDRLRAALEKVAGWLEGSVNETDRKFGDLAREALE